MEMEMGSSDRDSVGPRVRESTVLKVWSNEEILTQGEIFFLFFFFPRKEIIQLPFPN